MYGLKYKHRCQLSHGPQNDSSVPKGALICLLAIGVPGHIAVCGSQKNQLVCHMFIIAF